MLFIGFAIVVAIALALLISSDAGTLVGLTQQQTGQLVPLLILLIVFAGGAFARRRNASELIGSLALWAGLFGIAMVGYAYRDDLNGIAARVFGELMPGTAIVDRDGGTATFRKGRDGHFQIKGQINGADITMIFDTGASAVVLSSADARKAGIDTASLRFNVPVSTANGTGRAASVVLDRMEIGGIVRNRVRAFIAEASALDTSLLGMSFLETLSRYTVSSNSLELTD
ncbi:MAG: TIGR02281 family clan AA aspartic protease [Devosia sp.]|nr:TIGR02281 family clan AA aspartic protease [Devosia sp.]